jgi:hypothetical protein
MTRNKRLQVQSRVVFIMNEHFNNYNPWWPRDDIAFCPSCPCCFTDRPRIHMDFSLIPRCDNPWKDTDFAFSVWAVLYILIFVNNSQQGRNWERNWKSTLSYEPTFQQWSLYSWSSGIGWGLGQVFNATFNNISVILWQSVLLVEETWVPRKNHWPVTSHWQTLSY